MARARYTVYAPPNGIRVIGTALTPPMHGAARAWMSAGRVYGQPGTQAVPAPSPTFPRGTSDLASGGRFYSTNVPNVWFPRLYHEADQPKEHAPVSRISDNQIPVPANTAAGTLISRAAYVARIGGRRQIAQPQVIQRWPGLRGTAGG